MAPHVAWFLAFLVLYAGVALAWAAIASRKARTAEDFLLGGRALTPGAFVPVATATTLSALAFTAHAGLVSRDGLPYGRVALFLVAASLVGALIFKRQWMLGRRYGYATLGEMLADYYRGEGVRLAAAVVALALAVPFLALNLAAAGAFVGAFVGGPAGPVEAWATWLLGLFLLVVAAGGGFPAVAPVAAVQCLAIAIGIFLAGTLALDAGGGWEQLQARLAGLGATDVGTWGTTRGRGGGEYNALLAVPGTIQFTAGLGRETPAGGPWTGVMGLAYLTALVGVQFSPAFTQLALASPKAAAFARQQTWASAGVAAFLLVVFGGALGLADAGTIAPARLDGWAPLAEAYFDAGAARLFRSASPWLGGLLALAAVAAFQAVVVHAVAAGGVLARDLYRRHLNPTASDADELRASRLAVAAVVLMALALAAFARGAAVQLGGLALAVAAQMAVPLAGLCWLPWLTRAGVGWGFAAGVLGVVLTDDLGIAILDALGVQAWGRWPWTVHSAGWGLVLNVAVAIGASALTQDRTQLSHRLRFHRFLGEHAGTPPEKRGLKPLAWIAALCWLFFGVGPGAVIGNDLFRAPDAGVAAWTFGMPSLWAWQVMLWAFGVALVWFLAYRMELSTPPATKIERAPDDGPGPRPPG